MGGIRFTPGVNEVDEKKLRALTPALKASYKRKLSEGVLVELEKKTSLTAKMVRETADLTLLHSWEADKTIKGPIKTAVRKQIAEIESVQLKPTEEAEEDL